MLVDSILFIIIGLFSLVFHELGHVTAARLNHAEKIQLTIGAGKALFACSIGRLDISVQRIFFMRFAASSRRKPMYSSKEIMMISLMGPVFDILLAIVFYVLYSGFFAVYILYIGFLFNMWLAIINLLPFKIGQKATDGYIVYKAMTGLR